MQGRQEGVWIWEGARNIWPVELPEHQADHHLCLQGQMGLVPIKVVRCPEGSPALGQERVLSMTVVLYMNCRAVLSIAENVSCRAIEDGTPQSSHLTQLIRMLTAQVSHTPTAPLLALFGRAFEVLHVEPPGGPAQQFEPCQTQMQTRLPHCGSAGISPLACANSFACSAICTGPHMLNQCKQLRLQRNLHRATHAQPVPPRGGCLCESVRLSLCMAHGGSWLVTCLLFLTHL